MKSYILHPCALAASIMLCFAANAQAQYSINSQLCGGSNCCSHVIRLIAQHGVNNSFDRGGASCLLNNSHPGPMMVPVEELGDLQILQVSQLAPESPDCGPKFTVMIMNQSCRKVCNFHISAVAVFGRICPDSPSVTVAVEQINPGEALEVCLQLPLDAYAMGNRNGEILGFQKLIVAIDSYDEFVETDEANNIKAFDAAAIAIVATTIEQPVLNIEGSSPQPIQQMQGQAPAPVQQPIRQGGEVSVDAVDLEQPTPDSLRSAIQQLGSLQPEQTVAAQGFQQPAF